QIGADGRRAAADRLVFAFAIRLLRVGFLDLARSSFRARLRRGRLTQAGRNRGRAGADGLAFVLAVPPVAFACGSLRLEHRQYDGLACCASGPGLALGVVFVFVQRRDLQVRAGRRFLAAGRARAGIGGVGLRLVVRLLAGHGTNVGRLCVALAVGVARLRLALAALFADVELGDLRFR